MISIADKKFRGRDKIVQKMTKDGLVDENLRTGEQKSATAEEKPKQEDSANDTAEKEADEEPIMEEELCMDAEDGEEDAPRHHSTAKQSADYYKAHQEEGKPKDAPAEPDAEPQPTKKGRLSFEDEKGGIVCGVGMGVKKVAKKGVDTATGFAHQKVHQVEKDNSGVEAAHKSEEAAERLHHFVKGRKKPKDKSARAEKRGGENQKSSRLKFSESEGGTAENAAEPQPRRKQTEGEKKIDISQMAEDLGVSKTTVSRALSGNGRVSEATRARVVQYAKEKNYVPNMLARGLVTQQSYNISLVFSRQFGNLAAPFLRKTVSGGRSHSAGLRSAQR